MDAFLEFGPADPIGDAFEQLESTLACEAESLATKRRMLEPLPFSIAHRLAPIDDAKEQEIKTHVEDELAKLGSFPFPLAPDAREALLQRLRASLTPIVYRPRNIR